MHIPDGLLSVPIWLGLDLLSAPGVAAAARRAQRQIEPSRIPLLGLMGAFVFAAQMINFPVGAGTSAHLLGGLLLAITLGPPAAIVVMTAILLVQALIFQDGGLLALGANVFNMALAGILAGYMPYALWGGGKWRPAAILAGGALSVGVSGALALVELVLSGAKIPTALLGVSVGLFLINGLLEGLITLAVSEGVAQIKAALVQRPAAQNRAGWAGMGLLAVLLALAGVFLASESPDILESLTAKVGLASKARALLWSPLADYQTWLLGQSWLSKAAAGLAGLALIYLACLGIGKLATKLRSK